MCTCIHLQAFSILQGEHFQLLPQPSVSLLTCHGYDDSLMPCSTYASAQLLNPFGTVLAAGNMALEQEHAPQLHVACTSLPWLFFLDSSPGCKLSVSQGWSRPCLVQVARLQSRNTRLSRKLASKKRQPALCQPCASLCALQVWLGMRALFAQSTSSAAPDLMQWHCITPNGTPHGPNGTPSGTASRPMNRAHQTGLPWLRVCLHDQTFGSTTLSSPDIPCGAAESTADDRCMLQHAENQANDQMRASTC